MSLRRLAALAFLWLVPSVAWACPYCAGRKESVGQVVLLGSMILLPSVIVLVVWPVVKRVVANADRPFPPGNEQL